MNILIVNTSERTGGAAVAAGRLVHALQSQGTEVSFIVRDQSEKATCAKSVRKDWLKKLPFIWERLSIFIANKLSRKRLFEVSIANAGWDITKLPEYQAADIIHLHWINQGMLSLHSLRKIFRSGKPVVWTMHDLWPVTGICHYSGACKRYQQSCGFCPLLRHPSENDLSRRTFRKKKKIMENASIQFVSCSKWLLHCAEISNLGVGNSFTQIPNPIDTDFFMPNDIEEAKHCLNLNPSKKYILFGAYSITDERKGIRYLIEATHFLSDLSNEVELVFCGEMKQDMTQTLGLKVQSLGYITEPAKMVEVYQAMDCYVIPSLEENLPNMIMEAMACGVPCVGFQTGGIPEMIQHKETGYLAQYQSAEDLANGIRSIVTGTGDEKSLLRNNVREFVVQHYSESKVAQQYIQLYQKRLFQKAQTKTLTTP